MNVVYALTRNVYNWILPSIRSLAEHNPDAMVYILCEDNALPFDLPIEADVIDVSGQEYFPRLGEHRTEAFGGYINHLKVYYPELLPCDKVIHLDIDTIICDSLEQLWATEVSEKWFAAVPESQKWYRPYGPTYYNMGVALINLGQMRKDKIAPVMGEYLRTENRPFADQDAWNRFGSKYGKACALDIRFNESRVTGKTAHPAIVHYCATPDWWTNRKMDRIEYLEKYRKGYEDTGCGTDQLI